MLRTPKCALHTIRYLKKRIPENVELAVQKIDEIHLCEFDIVIQNG
jgi:hypothetical protein